MLAPSITGRDLRGVAIHFLCVAVPAIIVPSFLGKLRAQSTNASVAGPALDPDVAVIFGVTAGAVSTDTNLHSHGITSGGNVFDDSAL